MGDKTGIEWTDATWNPIRGCSRVSEGCRNCYAEKVAARFSGEGMPYEGLARLTSGGARWTGAVRVVPDKLEEPLRWKRPRRIFVNSMSDLFHPAVDDITINRIFEVMYNAPRHVFQVLTKRPERMLDYVSRNAWLSNDPLPNVWLGVSVEHQPSANDRIWRLLQTPAAVRWLSIEPLLRGINLFHPFPALGCSKDDPTLADLHWIVVGGESGTDARPMHPEWVRTLRDECADAGVPFFFKQWGNYVPAPDDVLDGVCVESDGSFFAAHFRSTEERMNYEENNGAALMCYVGKKVAGRVLDGRTWDEYPEVRAC